MKLDKNGPSPATFYFDRDCGLCQASARYLWALAEVEVVPARPGLQGLPREVSEGIDTAAYAQVGGEFYRGHEAIGAVLRTHGSHAIVRWCGAALMLRPLHPLWERAYHLVAEYRHVIGARLGLSACRLG